jgi:hypothetical protein
LLLHVLFHAEPLVEELDSSILPVKCEREAAVLQWAFKLNSALTAAETWGMKGRTLKVKILEVYMAVCFILFL